MERSISMSSDDADLIVLSEEADGERGRWAFWSAICCTMDHISSTTLLWAANFVCTETWEDQMASRRSR